MLHFVEIVTSPFVVFIVLCTLTGVVATVKVSSDRYKLIDIADSVASGMSMLFILVLAATFYNIGMTCHILVDDKLLQFEWAVIAFVSLFYMLVRFITNFDPKI
jgi:hypothetical protein